MTICRLKPALYISIWIGVIDYDYGCVTRPLINYMRMLQIGYISKAKYGLKIDITVILYASMSLYSIDTTVTITLPLTVYLTIICYVGFVYHNIRYMRRCGNKLPSWCTSFEQSYHLRWLADNKFNCS